MNFRRPRLMSSNNSKHLTSLYMRSYMTMGDQKIFDVVKDSIQPLQYRCLYNIGGMRFVLPEPLKKGKIIMAPIPENKRTASDQSALIMTITAAGETKEVEVSGRRDVINPPTSVEVGGLTFHLNYGSVRVPLPFKVKLDDFIADKCFYSYYPFFLEHPRYSSICSKISIFTSKSHSHF